jgi:hypothetical protein
MNKRAAKALRKKAAANVRETYGTPTANLCQKEYKGLKKKFKNVKGHI